ncbi:MAG TPA: hypothetical protein DCK93_18940 [Blastocatellia bacterium]|nr:hypothetical protein [Blastocatellia bacterium]
MSLNQDAASAQRGRTVRIVTESPVLVQGKNSVKRKGRNKPTIVLKGDWRVALSLTDSGELVITLDPP